MRFLPAVGGPATTAGLAKGVFNGTRTQSLRTKTSPVSIFTSVDGPSAWGDGRAGFAASALIILHLKGGKEFLPSQPPNFLASVDAFVAFLGFGCCLGKSLREVGSLFPKDGFSFIGVFLVSDLVSMVVIDFHSVWSKAR